MNYSRIHKSLYQKQLILMMQIYIYMNVLKQTLQDEIEFISYLIKYKTYNLADSLVTQLFNNICKDIFHITIFLIYGQENQHLQVIICQCALSCNIVIADKLFQQMPLPDEIPLQTHYLTHVQYICIYTYILIVVLLLNPGT